jgi:hypothetical protein
MTGAERVQRWKERHARKLAKKAEREPMAFTGIDDFASLFLQPTDLVWTDGIDEQCPGSK